MKRHGFLCLHCHHRWKDDATDPDAPQCPECGSIVCFQSWPVGEKLIRDGIVERVQRENGIRLLTRKAAEDEVEHLLLRKLLEEAGEFAAKPSLEELADVMEVVHAIMKRRGWSADDVERMAGAKRLVAGAFAERTVLVMR